MCLRNLLCSALLLAPVLGAQTGAPSISPGGIVNAATYTTTPYENSPLAPVFSGGSMASIFGQNLATGTVTATTLPLPTTLGETTVFYVEATSSYRARLPLFYVSPTQINFQIPSWGYGAGRSGYAGGHLVIQVGTQETESGSLLRHDSVPGLFTVSGSAQNVNYLTSARDNSLIGPAHSAEPGEIVTLYLTGLGPARAGPPGGDPFTALLVVVADGYPAPLSSPEHVYTTPHVMVDSQSAPVLFAGLAPGFVGLNQLNFIIPVDAPEGCRIPLSVVGDLYASPTAFVSIRRGGGACQN